MRSVSGRERADQGEEAQAVPACPGLRRDGPYNKESRQ